MQIADIKATQVQFEASLGIDTFGQLCTVLSYLSENKELNKQLCNAYHDVMPNCVFNKQFNHVFLNSEQAFGKYYSKYDIDLLMADAFLHCAPSSGVWIRRFQHQLLGDQAPRGYGSERCCELRRRCRH
jgi:hypothetical protein